MNKCSACGKEYKLNRKDGLLRKGVTLFSKRFPVLHQVVKESESYCNSCWHHVVDPTMEPFKEK